MADKIGISAEQVAAGFDRGVGALDDVRARQIADALRLESAKAAVFAREQVRLSRKYGAEHLRTKEAAARTAGNLEYRKRLLAEHVQAAKVGASAAKPAPAGAPRTPPPTTGAADAAKESAKKRRGK